MPSIQEVLDQVPESEREECPTPEIDVDDYIFDQPHLRWFTVGGKNRLEMQTERQGPYIRYWNFRSDSLKINIEGVGEFADGVAFPEDGFVVRRKRGV